MLTNPDNLWDTPDRCSNKCKPATQMWQLVCQETCRLDHPLVCQSAHLKEFRLAHLQASQLNTLKLMSS